MSDQHAGVSDSSRSRTRAVRDIVNETPVVAACSQQSHKLDRFASVTIPS